MGLGSSDLSAILNTIKVPRPGAAQPTTCRHCDATAPLPGTETCGCGATIFPKPEPSKSQENTQ